MRKVTYEDVLHDLEKGGRVSEFNQNLKVEFEVSRLDDMMVSGVLLSKQKGRDYSKISGMEFERTLDWDFQIIVQKSDNSGRMLEE